MAEKKFDPRWLEGLIYHSAENKMIEKNGRKTLQGIPTQRPAKEQDVLGWTDYGDKVVIAIKDGKKYTVEKNPKPKASEKEMGEPKK